MGSLNDDYIPYDPIFDMNNDGHIDSAEYVNYLDAMEKQQENNYVHHSGKKGTDRNLPDKDNHQSICSSGEKFILLLITSIMAMPFVGVYVLATGKNAEERISGVMMLVVGIFIYLIVIINSI